MTKPLLSIVIANYNYGRFLEEAIQSVVSQGMGDKVELIICDAKSTDNSVEIIKKYAGGLPPNTPLAEWLAEPSNPETLKPSNHLITWWCSEKDGGQSAAFNKGFSHALGEWVTWLNSDDMYASGALRAFERRVRKAKKALWVTGNMIVFDDDSRHITRTAWGPHICMPFLRRNHAQLYPFGPTSFWRRSLFNVVGCIDENLDYTMDLDMWARLTMCGIVQTRLNCFCWLFRAHTDAKSTGERTKLKIGDKEYCYWSRKTGYTYRNVFSNPWYCVWLFFRILDGSLIVRQLKRIKLIGKDIVVAIK